MIFGRLTTGSREIVLVGLSAENVRMMQAGKPLSIGPVPNDAALSKTTIIVMAGETEKDILEALKTAGMISQDTSITDIL